ncbi:hypothetical protein FKZ61_014505 [Litorilinea aerophila]|uniref:Uncharacterized protein n=1 Tax=Litorilinea aerophila TaxID=1204385 RepID=A0A540VE00_9CHLR|nr:hypothetical protein [Litorilinea aerophila]MCC9077314.1 hypothetical protein [Litorilinea aerophila]
MAAWFPAWPLAPRQALAAPTRQGTPGVQATSPTLYLVPQDATVVVLHTHVATFQLQPLADGRTSLGVELLFRLKNPSQETVNLVARLDGRSGPLAPEQAAAFPDLSASVDGQALSFQPLVVQGNQALGLSLSLAAEAQRTVRLRYTVTGLAGPLAGLRYDPAPLRGWSGTPSVRVTVQIPPAIPPESWLGIAPDGWRYGLEAPAEMTAIQWLFDNGLPRQPFHFQFVAPSTWGQLQAARQAAVSGAPPDAFRQLGDLYRQLYAAADVATQGSLRARFYALALAAYTDGLTEHERQGLPPAAATELHLRLADLYRNRAADVGGNAALPYARLLVEQAAAALEGLPADDRRRAEVMRWQTEGLYLLLSDARQRREWPQALQLIEEIARLSPTAAEQETLAEMRRTVRVQQALDLLEQGQRDAAMALAAEELSDLQLQPPPQFQPLFARWQVTVTTGLAGTTLKLTGEPSPGREADARAALEGLLQQWSTALTQDGRAGYDINLAATPPQATTPTSLTLTITYPDTASGVPLARALPATADWALLRELLLQIRPETTRRSHLLWQQVSLRQPLDLRRAGDQWAMMATDLERQAAQFEAQAAPDVWEDVARLETALQAHVQAANYRVAAQAWRDLLQESWVLVELQAGSSLLGTSGQGRSWLVTATTPSQMLTFDGQMVNPGRAALSATAGFFGLFLLAGMLWRLL